MQPMVANRDDKTLFAASLNHILDEIDFVRGSGRVKEFHRKVKDLWPPHAVSYETVRKWLSGESIPKTSRLPALAEFLGVETYELLPLAGGGSPARKRLHASDEFTVIGPDGGLVQPGDDDFEYVDAFRVGAAAGSGRSTYTPEPNGKRAYSVRWLREEGLIAENLIMIEADGDSMAPEIRDGDSILVDKSQREIVNGEVYVFRVDHDLRVKRLWKNLNGTITVTSDNKSDPAYREEIFTTADLETMDVIGMVVHRSGRIGRRSLKRA